MDRNVNDMVKRIITRKIRVGLIEYETTRSRDASPPKIRVVSDEYCIDMTAVSTKGRLGKQRRLRTQRAPRKGPRFLYHNSSRAQMSKVISFEKPTKELGLTSYMSRLLNHMNSPNVIHNGWRHALSVTGRGWWFIPHMMHRGWR
jgi:hypothetical protein